MADTDEHSTQCASDIAAVAKKLFMASYRWSDYIRAVTVRAINLVPAQAPMQISLFNDEVKREKMLNIEKSIDEIRRRFGYDAITYATLMGNLKMPDNRNINLTMPALAGR